MKMNNNDDGASFLSWDGASDARLIVNPPTATCISLSDMDNGRDEMNLVEFPLAGLANRSPKGIDTLVFEDCTWDKQQRANVRKRLTVTASAEFGLPTASDDETILGRVQLAKAGQFADRRLTFIPAELFRLLGWREEGRSYSRLEASLKRWLGVTLYYDHAWWDKQRQAWVDEHFHLLENVTVRRRRKSTVQQRRSWSVTWNEVMFRSCQAGYLKRLDMSIYRQLSLAAAKRMYRFLDKRFYFTNRLTFDLRTFACEHIGFRRGDDNSQLKRRLNRAIDQLEHVGFLESLPAEARYQKLRRGRWEVVFQRKRANPAKPRTRKVSDTQEAALVKRGIRQPVATRLVREHPDSSIRAALKQFDELISRGQESGLTNPPGLLVAWIREQSESSPRNANEREDVSVKNRQRHQERLNAVRKREIDRDTEARSELEAVRVHLDKLPPEELESLELNALSQANRFQLQCYRRSHTEENAEMLQKYRDIIVEDHVRRLLGLSSK